MIKAVIASLAFAAAVPATASASSYLHMAEAKQATETKAHKLLGVSHSSAFPACARWSSQRVVCAIITPSGCTFNAFVRKFPNGRVTVRIRDRSCD